MNQEKIGQDGLQRQSRQDFENVIKSYWEHLGITAMTPDHLALTVLTSTHEDRKNWTEEELNDASFALVQYALFLQKEENFHRARLNWANSNMKILFGNFGYKYGNQYTKYDEKMAMMVGNSKQAELLHRFIKDVQGYLDTLYFISTKIEKLAKILDDRQQIMKRKQYQ